MADHDEIKDTESPIALTITKDGKETVLTAAEVIEMTTKSEDAQSKFMDESISYIGFPQSGLIEIDIHPNDPHNIFNGLVKLSSFDESSALHQGRYFILTDLWMEENKAEVRHES